MTDSKSAGCRRSVSPCTFSGPPSGVCPCSSNRNCRLWFNLLSNPDRCSWCPEARLGGALGHRGWDRPMDGPTDGPTEGMRALQARGARWELGSLESLGLPAVSQIHVGQWAERSLLRGPSTPILLIIFFCRSSSGKGTAEVHTAQIIAEAPLTLS